MANEKRAPGPAPESLRTEGEAHPNTPPVTAIHTLDAEADQLLQRMQTPEAQQALDRAFHGTPEQMGLAAHRAAKAAQQQVGEQADA